jgi:hypothetical protein
MTESAKAAFNDKLRQKAAGKAPEKKAAPEELIERAGAALEELRDVLAELAAAGSDEEEKTK